MTTTTWLNSRNPSIEIPTKVRAWAENQAVRVESANEVLTRWMRFDGETLVVRG